MCPCRGLFHFRVDFGSCCFFGFCLGKVVFRYVLWTALVCSLYGVNIDTNTNSVGLSHGARLLTDRLLLFYFGSPYGITDKAYVPVCSRGCWGTSVAPYGDC